jgi:hypothetical protein
MIEDPEGMATAKGTEEIKTVDHVETATMSTEEIEANAIAGIDNHAHVLKRNARHAVCTATEIRHHVTFFPE